MKQDGTERLDAWATDAHGRDSYALGGGVPTGGTPNFKPAPPLATDKMVEPGWWLTQVTTLLVAGLGVAVLWIRPHTKASRALGWLLVCYGLSMFGLNISNPNVGLPVPVRQVLVGMAAVAGAGVVLSAILLVRHFPDRLATKKWLAFWPIFISVGAVFLAPLQTVDLTDGTARNLGPWWVVFVNTMFTLTSGGIAALAGASAALAFRYTALPRRPEMDASRRQLRIMAAGLMVPAVFTMVHQIVANWYGLAGAAAIVVFSAIVAGPWLVAMRGDARPKGPRNVAWLALTVAVIAAYMATNNINADDLGVYGLVRLVSCGILAYGVLQAQMLGLDVKVRFAVKSSTLAALFVGAFFAASELAQQFFGEQFQSQYLGIAAAGLLVMAIAPMQRWAERLAEKAVPRTGSAPMSAVADIYREQVQTAWVDGTISANEKIMLRKLREKLAIAAHDAEAIEADIEAKAARRRKPTARSAKETA